MARANVANTKVVVQSSTLAPYHNDYDETKNFHQILFKPGYAVQGRELTQLQTILQNQIERFGLHIFENGSSVIGGDTSISTAETLNLTSTYAGTDIDVSDFVNKTIRFADANNTVIARVIQGSIATDSEPPAIHVKYLTGQEFGAGDTIKIEGEETYANLIGSANATSNSQIGFIYDSIYFYDGYFIKVPSQTVVLSKFDTLANCRIGLELDDSIVTTSSDTSLLDPALGASNYQAPGADRYKKELILSRRDLDSIDDTKFIEIMRVEEGAIQSKVQYPLYSEIEEVLARRTYDESGSYTVKEFKIRLQDGEDNANNVSVRLSPGKAYIRGYEYETVGETKIELPRARTTANVNNYDLNLNYGNYVIVSDVEGIFDPTNQEVVDIHNVPYTSVDHANQGAYDATKIGTARVRDIEFFTGTDVATRKHELYIFGTQFTGAASFASANAFVKSASYTPGGSGIANANIDVLNFDSGLASGNATITEAELSSLVFPFPEKYVAENSIQLQSFQFRKKFTGVSFTAGVSGAIIAGTDEQFVGTSASSNVASTVTNNFLVIVNDALSSGRANGDQIAVTTTVSGDPEEVIFDTGAGGTDTFSATVLAKMEIDGASAGERSKSLVKANSTTLTSDAVSNTFVNSTGSTTVVYLDAGQVTITNPSRTPGVNESLFISDVFGIKKIYDLAGAAIPAGGSSLTGYADVTDRFTLDTGQRDTFYNHASIRLKPGVTSPQGPLVVCTRYFKTTSDFGYFSVDSYPSLMTDITEESTSIGTGYSIIPSFLNSAGEQVFLRDSIDFRPVRTNASNTSVNFGLGGARVPVATTDFQSSYAYYLARRDLVVLTPNRKMKIVSGIPSKYPQNPSAPTNAMVLYALGVAPYTSYPANVAVQFVDNRRYTMRDIGIIDKRLRNVEYYVTLNTLEKDALDISITDVDGLNRTKYGILADNFNSHELSDSDKFDYQCAMNYKQGWLQNKANNNAFGLDADLSTATDVAVKEDKIFLDYTEEEFINQNTATKFTAVAEFLFADYNGTIVMVPDSDIWKSVNVAPALIQTTFENNESFDTITVSSTGAQQDAINDIIGGDVQSRTRGRTSRSGRRRR